jgi:FMN phosphatase YigB (HAD superfamily)
MLNIINLMLNPAVIGDITEPIRPVVVLAKSLHDNGYPLYLCANCPTEFYQALEKKYPDIMKLFKGTIISSKVHLVKPEKQIFQLLLDTYKLTPEKCILIDSQRNNIDVAHEMKMQTITYETPSQLTSQLKKLGIN